MPESAPDVLLLRRRRVERLRRLDACAVSDAMDRLQLPGAVSGVPQASGAARIAKAPLAGTAPSAVMVGNYEHMLTHDAHR